jgi:uridine phosphorylase
MKRIAETDLILNKDGSVYHLNLKPDDVADLVFTVGDPERVSKISRKFDKIFIQKSNREFVTHTGELNGQNVTVISTGIGTDNIDIVLNELDALANIDFETRMVRPKLKSLEIIRLGTSGSMQIDIQNGTLITSAFSIGLDGLLLYYQQHLTGIEMEFKNYFLNYCNENLHLPMNFYVASADKTLIEQFNKDFKQGITITCPGFYAPQGRQVRALNPDLQFLENLSNFSWNNMKATNFEMETSGIYGLGSILGHKCLSCNVILANRKTGKFSNNPEKEVEKLIDKVLQIKF